MITHALGDVEYQESGSGSVLLFVPGSFSTGASWRSISAPLSERYRTIATSLLGYGKTQERRTPGSAWMQQEMDALDTVLARIQAPVHLVAHSFGACVALSLAMHRQPAFLSMTLLEPTVFYLLNQAGDRALSRQVRAITDTYMAAWEHGDPRAVQHVIDFYGGPGAFAAYPPAVQDKVMAMTATNILDWQTGDAQAPTPADIASVNTPTWVVCGSHSHPAMQRCNQLLVDTLPHAQLQMLEGANHFMVTTHAAELTRGIEQRVSSLDR
ncbi:alpha/beta fold hydrolase [Acidovorax sp. FJL06]|uniref:alpha/beta fold hydrolase n=1 Tax=Acidovorax sp. FJL06 TaxID=2153365 RepID=UPI000F57C291|nr:alpha/beta hydrolase [Acidovorax sp. FJL06]RQO82743.1 alpha/beta hydrolase [Acidovorax sp. FJL06]